MTRLDVAYNLVNVTNAVTTGRLKMRDWKMRE